ncbi:hypothetical protein F4604DRAFT_387843 [Suillus subluteus]|nr:hypothetical protein F4604DRAFT_387843 [Suillus subluteus]
MLRLTSSLVWIWRPLSADELLSSPLIPPCSMLRLGKEFLDTPTSPPEKVALPPSSECSSKKMGTARHLKEPPRASVTLCSTFLNTAAACEYEEGDRGGGHLIH